MYEYNARCIHVVDGGTYHFEVDLGFHTYETVCIRLADYAVPQLHAPCLAEREHAEQAKTFCERLLLGDGAAPTVRLRTFKDGAGKHLRYLAEIWMLEDETDEDGFAWPAANLGELLEFEGLLKRESYPPDAEAIMDRQHEHRIMAEKRAMEGVMTPDETTPID